MRGSSSVAAYLSALLLSLPFAAVAEPQAGDAETLFREGRQLLKDGNNQAACAKLEASYRLEPASGALLGMAICHEALGKFASAWSDYHLVLERARIEGRTDREHAARDALADLAPKLSTLVVLVPDLAHPITVTCDSRRVEDLTSPHPVDPGPHRIEVSAPGMLMWRTDVNVTAPGQSVVVTVPRLLPVSSQEVADQGASNTSMPPSTPVRFVADSEGTLYKATPSRRTTHTGQGTPPWMWTTFGVGVIATSAGLVLAGLAWDKKGSLNCPDDRCPSALQHDVDAYHNLRSGCLISLAVGVSALAAGLIHSLYDPDHVTFFRNPPARAQ